MFSQQRYKNLISSIGKIYTADDTKARTELLEGSLCTVMDTLNPQTDVAWRVVRSDTDRILKVWESLEESPTAHVVVEQFKDILCELSTMTIDISSSTVDDDMNSTPTTLLEMLTLPIPMVSVRSTPNHSMRPTPVVSAQPTPVVSAQPTPVVSAQPTPVVSAQPTPVVSAQPTPVVSAQPTPVVSAQPTPVVSAQPTPVASAQPTPILTAQPVPVHMEVDDIQEPEEEEEEEEEDEGAELEQITLRGRTYYFDRAAGSIYAILDDDEVGDEVGVLKDGKVRFHAK